MAPVHIGHGWQLVYRVVAAAVARSSSRAAHRASFCSGCAAMSPSASTVLWSSASTRPSGPTSSEPYGACPPSREVRASAMARRRNSSSSRVMVLLPSEPPLQDEREAVLGVGGGHLVGDVLQRGVRVAHRDTVAR